MSSAQSLEDKLEALQSHFTWELQPSRSKLTYLRIRLEDIGTEEGNFWLGHVYNLLGFIQYQLGSSEDTLNLFNRAAETSQRQKNADEGPWLMVNFGNLAWLHHHLGEDEKSEDYLSKVDGLMRKYPAPPELELHPEVLAEKAWTLMKFDKEKKQQALELFQRAIRMQPDTVEWRSSYAILSTEFLTKRQTILEPEVFERLRSAKEQDPGNLYVAALYLEARAAKQEQIHDEARELAERILERPMNGYCGFGPLLRLYRKHISKDEAVEIAIEALRRHPDSRYTKKSSAKCYRKQIFGKQSNPDGSRMDEAICLWDEMIAAHPESGLKDKITLADLHATQQKTKDKADEIYKKLLEEREDLDPAGLQMLYCRYAKHLYFSGHDSGRSIEYHMKAAEIQETSKYRQKSLRQLKTTVKRNTNPELYRRIREVETSLRNFCLVDEPDLPVIGWWCDSFTADRVKRKPEHLSEREGLESSGTRPFPCSPVKEPGQSPRLGKESLFGQIRNQTQQQRSDAESLTKKILSKDYRTDSNEINGAIRLWEEVIHNDPQPKLEDKITLASIHAKLDTKKAEQIYKELLEQRQDLDPAGKQMLYNVYAKHLFFMKNNSCESIEYHMRAAEIQEESKYRHSSITELKKTLTRETSRRNGDADLCKRIKELLARLGI
ncbi:interferon-induced protein with tetratricopeptide repeats 1-like [Xiphophorus couchianus]|uniref:interferon-induced protein with tetratricopeptide repeats 1-like n=1 Tax=Xiphophorus couchianus TaxID=32473 RepID=UPI00101639AB|nr:interferon-induced protein with tetratricopeptide repeats 1-like [Xiphophorus couchianus]